jgi:rfaE bifunctional protein kinase chain/domain
MKVFISGNFNVVHPGHIRLFKKARELGNRVIVGVYSSTIAKGVELFPDEDRVDAVANNSLVDEVRLITGPIEKLLEEIDPQIILKGREFEDRSNEEESYARKNGKRVVYSDGDPLFSESDLIKKDSYNIELDIQVSDLREKLGLNIADLNNQFKRIQDLRVLVIGDTIFDEYINCETLGLSREDSNVVFKPIDSAVFYGGASIVARHAKALGAHVAFLSVCPISDKYMNDLQSLLRLEGIEFHSVPELGRESIVKRRFRVDGSSRFRVTEGSLHPISKTTEGELIEKSEELISSSDLLIFSDFNYGSIPSNLPKRLLEKKDRNCFFSADSQISSQIGSLHKYKGIDYISSTEFEARVALNSQDTGLAKLITNMRSELSVANCIIKLGSDGLIFESQEKGAHTKTGAIPALNSNPRDVAGAGDSLLAASSLILATGGGLKEAAYLGSLAAAIQVGRVGNVPIRSIDISRWLEL